MVFLKYWGSLDTRRLWLQYVQFECISAETDNLNALFLACRVLEKNNYAFILKHFEKKAIKDKKK